MNIHYSSPLSQRVGTSVRKCKLQLKDITEEEILLCYPLSFSVHSSIKKGYVESCFLQLCGEMLTSTGSITEQPQTMRLACPFKAFTLFLFKGFW